VQARLAQQGKSGYKRPKGRGDLLQGLLWCGTCGYRMHGSGTTAQGHTYVCDRCYKSRSMKQIDHAIISWLLETGDVVHTYMDQADTFDDRDAEIARKEAELKVVTAERVELTRQFARHEIDADDYHAALTATDGDRARLQADIRRLETARERDRVERAGMVQAVVRARQRREEPDACEPMVGKREYRRDLRDLAECIVWDRAADTLTIEMKTWCTAPPQTVSIGGRRRGATTA
jgi:Recombinase zinc beta ribbon domain